MSSKLLNDFSRIMNYVNLFAQRGLLVDSEIKSFCSGDESTSMIYPFSSRLDNQLNIEGVMRKVPSFGLSSAGYDIRLSNKFKVFDPLNGGIIDPIDFNPKVLRDVTDYKCVIPPNSYILAATMEKFNMPVNVTATCVGKSTLARCGLILNVTPLEAGWKGYLTLEISNSTPLPAIVYAGMGIGQLQFHRHRVPRRDYNNREAPGKYHNQVAGPVTARN